MVVRVATYDRIPSRDPAILAALRQRRSAANAWIADQPDLWLYRAYLDQGTFGSAPLHQRPALQRLVTAARRHTFELLVVASLDRISRDPGVLLDLVAALQPSGITIRSLAADPPGTYTLEKLERHVWLLANLAANLRRSHVQ